jgi:multiple sugar transport system substrate-binding protein
VADRRIHELYRGLVNGHLTRRDFMTKAAAAGVSSTAISLFLKAASVRAQEGTPAPTPVPADVAAPAVATPCTGDQCLFSGQSVTFLMPNETIQVPLFEVRDEFEAATGAKLDIVLAAMNDTLPKLIEDIANNTGTFDCSIIGAWWMGELVEADYILPLDDYMKDPKFPQWNIDDVLPGARALMQYGGKTYVTAYDHDAQVFYYRRDLFTDPNHQAAFKDMAGYDLPNPPQTWDQVIDLAKYFNGKDLDGDGQPDSGVVMHLQVGQQAMFHFMTFSAPFVIGPDNPKLYWFDPNDMKPLIDSPGHVKAINTLVELSKNGPEAMFGWGLTAAWDYFLAGKAAMTFTWGDLGALAQETPERGGKSLVKGKTASAPTPGTMGYYNIAAGADVTTDAPNIVGNTTGGSWAPAISKLSKAPEAAYYLCALMATEPKQKAYAARGFDGVDPGATYEFPAPNGTGSIDDYVKAGWDQQDALDYTDAFFKNYSNPLQFPYLRIPGTFEYWLALDTHLSEAVTGQSSPEDALKNTASDFEDITERFGRDLQLASYKASLGFE